MTYADRWLLPEGVTEILPGEAEYVEGLRHSLLGLYRNWGYDLVIPPLMEYTQSLFIGLGQDTEINTFKVTDQLTGRLMGIRADITPQAARIDAHSYRRESVTRLCYAGHVLHTRAKNQLDSRTPIQVGVELFGESGLEADIEVISLLLETLNAAGVEASIDLGHVGIYRALAEEAGLSKAQELAYFNLLQHKAAAEIEVWVQQNITSEAVAQWFLALPQMAGGADMLAQAQETFAEGPGELLAALDELQALADVMGTRYPNAHLYFDLGEVRGYHYHTGLVFAAFAPGEGSAIANGGRYDNAGDVFGRGRAATGFNSNLMALARASQKAKIVDAGIYAAPTEDSAQWQAVQALRAAGERVICGLSDKALDRSELNCDRQLVKDGTDYVVKPW